jgi:hypothetical protein
MIEEVYPVDPPPDRPVVVLHRFMDQGKPGQTHSGENRRPVRESPGALNQVNGP